jgi:hypothetical protein
MVLHVMQLLRNYESFVALSLRCKAVALVRDAFFHDMGGVKGGAEEGILLHTPHCAEFAAASPSTTH